MELKQINEQEMLLSDKLSPKLKKVHFITHFLFNRFQFPGSRKLGRMISNFVLPPLKGKVFTPTIYNFGLCLDNSSGNEIYHLGFYEPATVHFIQNCLQPGQTFIDVGSSIGIMTFTSALCIGTKGKVFAFEPNPQRFENLLDGIRINGFSNIKAVNLGLGKEEADMKLYHDLYSPSMVKTDASEKYNIVKVVRFVDFAKDNQIEKIDFVKIDVEGFEDQVVEGMMDFILSTNPPILCIEYLASEHGHKDHNFIDVLTETGQYKMFQFQKTSRKISKLKIIKSKKDLHPADNVYFLTDKHLDEFKDKQLFKNIE